MGLTLTSAVDWWEESQMRVLVLGSLVVQFLLLIFTNLRRRAIPGWIRFAMWLAYLGGDAITIYALATLFNRHREDQGGGADCRSTLEVVWAPVLLIHLGGIDGITAYNIEDNELWTRHLLTAVLQVTVAIYVFCKSWPPNGDKRLLQAAIVMFVPGVLKCFAKPWDLKMASIKSLVSSSSPAEEWENDDTRRRRAKVIPVREQKDEGEAKAEGAATSMKDGDNPILIPPPHRGSSNIPPWRRDALEEALHEQRNEGGMDTLEQFVKGAKIMSGVYYSTSWTLDYPTLWHGEVAHKLFVDLPYPYPLRLGIFNRFWVLDEGDVYDSLRRGLASAFNFLYTKRLKETDGDLPLSSLWKLLFNRNWIQVSRVYLPWAAVGLFHNCHREAYSDTDVKITYALLCCTAALECWSYFELVYVTVHVHRRKREQWPEMVAQYNLIGYFARNKKHSNMMWIVRKFGCKDFLDQHWCMRSCLSSDTITELVLYYLKAGWRGKIHDPLSYRRFNDNRGQWALEVESCEDQLGWSVKGPFDESVLVWHIATDFCFFMSPFSEHIQVCDFANKVPSTWQSLLESLKLEAPTKISESKKCGERLAECKAVKCRQMSNYMVYLLFLNPEMLLPGTRRNLFTAAYNELNDILEERENKQPGLLATAYQELTDKRWNGFTRVQNAIREVKGILIRDYKQNPLSWSRWKHAPVREDELMERVISVMMDKSEKGVNKESNKVFMDDAWALAQRLLALGEKKMWEVILRVWVEMLCFSASRCRGYLHAKALGSGGEFLSYVWLLMFYMGMETFTERLQREMEELPSRVAINNNAARAPPRTGSGTASSSASRIHGRAAPSPSHLYTGASTSSSEIHMADMV